MIPSADKLKTLAEWWGVSEHWLHYVPPPVLLREKADRPTIPSLQTLALAKKIGALPEHQQYLVKEIAMQFYGRPLEDE